MNNPFTKNREPLFHITKRDSLKIGWRIGIRAIAIFSALIVCSIILAIAYKADPFTFIGSMFSGVFGTERRIWMFLFEVAILLGISIAIVPAFKMKYWNCGADGQVLMGCLACAGVMFYLGGKAPDGVVLLLSLLFSILFSVIWAVIPAIFKAFWNTNETLFTLMMNYIAIQFVLFFIKTWVTSGTGKLNPMKWGNLPQIYNQFLFPILIVALITAIISVYLKYTKQGYELSLVGESENSAKYAGINVKWVIIRTMIVSGIVCGLMGFILVNGYNHTVSDTTVGGRGFTGIIVTWMAGMNPVYMILTSVFVIFITRGTSQLISDLKITSSAFQDVIIGIFYFFIIGCEFFIRYKVNFKKKAAETPKLQPMKPEPVNEEEIKTEEKEAE